MAVSHLIFDVDGVLLDWSRGFLKWMSDEHGVQPRSSVHRRWDMQCCYPQLSPPEIGKLIGEFHHSNHYPRLEEVLGAEQAVLQLRRRFPKVAAVAVTACGLDPKSLLGRLKPMKHFQIDEVHAVGVTASKREAFRPYPAATSIVFEDRDKNAEVAMDLGMRVVLIDQPYNQHVAAGPLLFRALGWGQALADCPWLQKETLHAAA